MYIARTKPARRVARLPRWVVLPAVILTFFCHSELVHAEVTLQTIVSRAQATLEWDSALGFGVIVGKNGDFIFSPGSSWGLLNYTERIPTGSITRNRAGNILFTDRGAREIEAALGRAVRPQAVATARTTSTAATVAGKPRIAAIIIDPGHGGKDPGTIQPSSELKGNEKPLEEKNLVLKIGLDVYHELQRRYPHKKIVITRKTDVYLSLEQRTQIANRIHLKPNEAKIFISIHANASFDHQAHGFEVWYLPPSYKRTVVNPKTIGTDSKALLPILNNMREQEYETESIMLGKDVLSGIHGSVGSAEVDRGLKSNDWFVVRNSKMPAVLIETGFVSNAAEAAKLRTAAYQQKLANGIVAGISKFVTFFDSKSGFLE